MARSGRRIRNLIKKGAEKERTQSLSLPAHADPAPSNTKSLPGSKRKVRPHTSTSERLKEVSERLSSSVASSLSSGLDLVRGNSSSNPFPRLNKRSGTWRITRYYCYITITLVTSKGGYCRGENILLMMTAAAATTNGLGRKRMKRRQTKTRLPKKQLMTALGSNETAQNYKWQR